jgi:hypothetical protein
MPTLTYTETLTTVTCVCGINYAIPEDLYDQLKRHPLSSAGSKTVYCPLGHTWGIVGKSEADKMRELLEQERRHAASLTSKLDQEKAAHSSTKGQLTRTKKRVANGVCPCCHRNFVQLARHMTTKHPGYTK